MEKKNQKNRSEKLTTTIGDLLKTQGNSILETSKKKPNNYKKHNKNNKHKNFKERMKDKDIVLEPKEEVKTNAQISLKMAIDKAVEEGKLKATDRVDFDMRSDEEKAADASKEPIFKDSSMDALVTAFLAEPEEEKPVETPNKFIVTSEYVTKVGTDAKVRTDTFINK